MPSCLFSGVRVRRRDLSERVSRRLRGGEDQVQGEVSVPYWRQRRMRVQKGYGDTTATHLINVQKLHPSIDYDPVCGADGDSYDNRCEADCAGTEIRDVIDRTGRGCFYATIA